MYSEDCRYTKEHEWIKMEGDGGKLGITHFAQEQLGDIVYVELPEIGATFSAMETFGNIESVKAVSELFCPVAGEILEINQEVVDRPELVNEDPHGKGWLIVIRVEDSSELEKLLSAAQYQKYVEEEAES